jgi:hypothetical protein
MSSNLELWKKVEKTGVGLVSTYIVGADDDGIGGTQLKTVSHINRIKKATELFGVYGKCWGLKKIRHNEVRVSSGILMGIVDAIFFVNVNGLCKTKFEISNSTAISTIVNGGLSVNTGYRKQMESDLINKALSRLGFNADIYSDSELVKSQEEADDTFSGMELIDIGGESEEK